MSPLDPGIDENLLSNRTAAYMNFYSGAEYAMLVNNNLTWLNGGSLGFSVIDGTGYRMHGKADGYLNISPNSEFKFYPLEFKEWYCFAISLGFRIDIKIPLGGDMYPLAKTSVFSPYFGLSF